MRAAREGRASSGQGQARVARLLVARRRVCVRLLVAAESEVPLVC